MTRSYEHDDGPHSHDPWEWWLVVIFFLGLCLLCGGCRLECSCHHSSVPNEPEQRQVR